MASEPKNNSNQNINTNDLYIVEKFTKIDKLLVKKDINKNNVYFFSFLHKDKIIRNKVLINEILESLLDENQKN